MQKRLAILAVPLAYLALSVLMTWPLTAQIATVLPSSGDALQQTWILAWNAHILRSDPLHFWQAPIFYPYPDTAAYHDHHLIQSLVGAPIIWATSNPVLAHNVLLLLSFVLTGWGAFLLARDLLGRQEAGGRSLPLSSQPPLPPGQRGSKAPPPWWGRGWGGGYPAISWAAFIAGAGVAFSAYRIAHISQLNMLQTGWMLFALLFLRRLLLPAEQGGGRWRDALLCGLFVGLQTTNTFYYGFFIAILCGGYVALWALGAIWRRLCHGEALPWAILPRLLLVGLVAALIAVPLLLPYIGLYQTLGIVRTLREVDNWSAPLRAYVSVTVNNLIYARLGEAVIDSGEMVLFPGLLVFVLGLGAELGLLLRRLGRGAGRDWLFWGLVALGAFVLSLGTGLRVIRFQDVLPIPLPYLTLYRLLPGFGSMRVPARWGWLVTLALALFAALAIARLLARVRPPWHHALGAALLVVVLAEQLAIPLPLSRPLLQDVPPVYPWLGQPAQADIRTLIELPTGPIPRGDNLERITWRHFYSLFHWKHLPVAYGALIPFGALDLMRYLKDLPRPEALQMLQLVGVDTLVVHTDEYAPEALASLLEAFAASPQLRLRAEIGASRVYTLLPDQALALAPGDVAISNDERMPGEAVLGLIRRWQDEGRALYGPGRLRYYAPLRATALGQLPAYALLSDAEDPLDYGLRADTLVWKRAGLALYRRPEGALASLGLAAQVRGQFHPQYPARLDLSLGDGRLQVGERTINLGTAVGPLTLEIDCGQLRSGQLQVGGAPLAVPAGLSTIRLPLDPATPITVQGAEGETALLRLRVQAGAPKAVVATARPGVVATVEAAFAGDQLSLRAAGAGAPGLLVDVWGAATSDDHPVHLLSGEAPLAGDGKIDITLSLLRPDAAWLSQRGEPQDGRYIVYVKDPARPDGPGRAVAKFVIRSGQVAEPEAVPLPLTVVP
jgi:hypothetical protein